MNEGCLITGMSFATFLSSAAELIEKLNPGKVIDYECELHRILSHIIPNTSTHIIKYALEQYAARNEEAKNQPETEGLLLSQRTDLHVSRVLDVDRIQKAKEESEIQMSENKYKEFIDWNSADFCDEIFDLRKQVVYGFYEDEFPSFRQGTERADEHELEEIVTAEHLNHWTGCVAEERKLIIEIAKKWGGHEGVNYDTTTTASLLKLIKDAVEYDQTLKNKLNNDGL